jgi:hypothetical protein
MLHVFEEETVGSVPGLGQKEKLLLNVGSQIGEQQNLGEAASRETAPAGEFLVIRNGALFDQSLARNGERHHAGQGGHALPTVCASLCGARAWKTEVRRTRTGCHLAARPRAGE